MPLVRSENSRFTNSRRIIRGLLDHIHRSAAIVRTSELRLRQLQDSAQALELANSQATTLSEYATAGYFVLLANCLAAYMIDCILFSAAVEYFAELGFGGWPTLVAVARFLVPLAVILIEIHVALQLSSAAEEATQYAGPQGRYWFWLGTGFILSLAMPAVAIGTQLTANFASGDDGITIGLNVVTLGLAILALVTHAGILFGGNSAHEAKAFVVYTWKRRSLARQKRRAMRLSENKRQAVRSAFTDYMERLRMHSDTWPNARIDPGPFDAVARDLLNQIFGYEIIQQPNRGGYGNSDSQLPLHSAEQLHLAEAGARTNGDSKNGYGRTILARKEDGEVKF